MVPSFQSRCWNVVPTNYNFPQMGQVSAPKVYWNQTHTPTHKSSHSLLIIHQSRFQKWSYVRFVTDLSGYFMKGVNHIPTQSILICEKWMKIIYKWLVSICLNVRMKMIILSKYRSLPQTFLLALMDNLIIHYTVMLSPSPHFYNLYTVHWFSFHTIITDSTKQNISFFKKVIFCAICRKAAYRLYWERYQHLTMAVCYYDSLWRNTVISVQTIIL